eukprot:403361675
MSGSFIDAEDDDNYDFNDRQITQSSKKDNKNRDLRPQSNKLKLTDLRETQNDYESPRLATRESQQQNAKEQMQRKTNPRQTYQKEEVEKLKPTTSIVVSTNIVNLNKNQGYCEIIERRITKKELLNFQRKRDKQQNERMRATQHQVSGSSQSNDLKNTLSDQNQQIQEEDNEALAIYQSKKALERLSAKQSVNQRILENFFPETTPSFDLQTESSKNTGQQYSKNTLNNLDQNQVQERNTIQINDDGYPILFFSKESNQNGKQKQRNTVQIQESMNKAGSKIQQKQRLRL